MDPNRPRPMFPGGQAVPPGGSPGFRPSISASQSLPHTPTPQSPGVMPNHQSHMFGNSSKQVASPQPFSPSPNPPTPQSPDPVHDLPHELLEAGWRRFWSKREGREYFFNKFSKQSLWEMPTLGSPSGPSRHDPLGIQVDVRPASLSPGQAVAPVHRKHSIEGEALSPTMKSLDLKGPFWDFGINSNAAMFEKLPSIQPPPHNDIEIMRATLVHKLRQHYQELCNQREGIDAPRESFNRWLLERKVVDKGHDPMLPSNCDPMVSSAMMREIMCDIPIRLYRPKLHSQARKLVSSYAEAAKKLIDSRNASSESRKVVKWTVEDVFKWLRTQPSCSIDEYMKRLAYLKEQCGPHLSEAAKPSVESICTKMYQMSADFAMNINQKHWEVMKEHQIDPPPPLTRPPADKRMPCYAVHCIVPSPRLPTVELHEEGDTSCIRYKGEMMKINSGHLKKLNVLYRINCRDDPTQSNFLSRVWCLLRRYQTLFGLGQYEGHGLQGALPVSVFKVLNQCFGVTFECFASPLNCYFKQFCSAFGDTDSFFGSRGPVLDFHPVSGSFEANPPFGEELMEEMVKHFEHLLSRTQEPLSFIVFIPDWRNPPTSALLKMEASRWNRKQHLIPAYEHEYRSGGQHTCKENEVYYRAVHGTLVFFLQNDAGNKMWPPTDESLKSLLDAYKPQSKRKAEELPDDISPAKKVCDESARLSQSLNVTSTKGDEERRIERQESEESARLSRSDGLTLKRKASDDGDYDGARKRRESSMSSLSQFSDSGETTPGSAKEFAPSDSFGMGNTGFDYSPQKNQRRRESSISSFSSTGSSELYDRKLSTGEVDYSPIVTSSQSEGSGAENVFSPKRQKLTKEPTSKSAKSKETDISTTPNRRKGAEIPPPSPNKWSQIRDSPQKHRLSDGPGSRDPQNYFKTRPGLGFQSKNSKEETTPKKAPSADPFEFEEDEESTPVVTKSETQKRTSQRNNSGNSRRELRPRSAKR